MVHVECVRESTFVPVLGLPTNVIKYGSLPQKRIGSNRYLFLVIPGNPGVAEYYDTFMEQLYRQSDSKIPVWGISHAGHVRIPPDGKTSLYNKISQDVCTLQGQIKHKITFIKEHIPSDVKLILIGHSIGCYIILKLLDELDRHKVLRCFMLFPTIEHMATTENGAMFTPALKYFRWFLVLLTFFLSFLPDLARKKLIDWHFGRELVPECTKSATLSLLHPFSVSNSLSMAHMEMASVCELDERLVRDRLRVLSFYYGATDKWCPQQYYHNMKSRFPDADLRLCDKGYSHAFVLDASIEMADIVWEWVEENIET